MKTNASGTITQNLLTREFRYDSDRQRYLERDLDHATFVPAPTSTPQWHTHLGNAAWGDYSVTVDSSGFPVKSGVARYAFGLGLAQQTDASGTRTFHADQIGTTRALTDGSGNVSSSLAFSASGSKVRRRSERGMEMPVRSGMRRMGLKRRRRILACSTSARDITIQ